MKQRLMICSIETADPADTVDVTLDHVAIESARRRHRPLQIDCIAGRESPEPGLGERLGNRLEDVETLFDRGHGQTGPCDSDAIAQLDPIADRTEVDLKAREIRLLLNVRNPPYMFDDSCEHQPPNL
jgi:hypothetical protein